MDQKWRNRFMDMAIMVATWSKEPYVKVGAVFVDKNKRVLAMGYNGFPSGFNDNDTCCKDADFIKNNIIHAELNGIANAVRYGVSLESSILFCTRPPCTRCTSVLKQVGVEEIICKHQDDTYYHDHTLEELNERYARVDISFMFLKN